MAAFFVVRPRSEFILGGFPGPSPATAVGWAILRALTHNVSHAPRDRARGLETRRSRRQACRARCYAARLASALRAARRRIWAAMLLFAPREGARFAASASRRGAAARFWRCARASRILTPKSHGSNAESRVFLLRIQQALTRASLPRRRALEAAPDDRTVQLGLAAASSRSALPLFPDLFAPRFHNLTAFAHPNGFVRLTTNRLPGAAAGGRNGPCMRAPQLLCGA